MSHGRADRAPRYLYDHDLDMRLLETAFMQMCLKSVSRQALMAHRHDSHSDTPGRLSAMAAAFLDRLDEKDDDGNDV